MRMKKLHRNKVMVALLAGALIFANIFGGEFFPVSLTVASVKAEETPATGIHVAYHTQEEIRQYIQEQGITLDSLKMYGSPTTTYEEEPSVTAPYAAGKMSSESTEYALTVLNSVRYIAGLSEVQIKDEYQDKVQAAAVVNAANNQMSHSPEMPSGMSDELYQLGKSGAGSANLSTGSWDGTYAYHIVHSWMEDSDSYNIDRVGHRRWILNPAMQYTGFGQAKGTGGWSYYAMYAFDNAFGATEDYGVTWPAQNMPVEYFDSGSAWSISMGTAVDKSSITVKLTNLNDGQSWTFSNASSDGDFYVSNENYGKQGCIIFRPSSLSSYAAGDSFQVEITGLEKTVSYQVKFFSLVGAASSPVPSAGASVQPGESAAPCESSLPDIETSQTPNESSSPLPGIAASETPGVISSIPPSGSAAPLTSNQPGIQTSSLPSESAGGAPSEAPDESSSPLSSIPPNTRPSGFPEETALPSGTPAAAGETGHPSASPKSSVKPWSTVSPSASPKVRPTTAPTVRPTGTPALAQEETQAPAKAKIISVKNKKNKKLVVKIKAQKNCSGYQVQYGIGKRMKKAKRTAGKGTTVTLKGLKKKKVYYVRVRSYRTVHGVRLYGAWSKPVKRKIKK